MFFFLVSFPDSIPVKKNNIHRYVAVDGNAIGDEDFRTDSMKNESPRYSIGGLQNAL